MLQNIDKLWIEAHVENPVHFVEHEKGDPVQPKTLPDVVDKTTFAGLQRTWLEKQNKFVLNWEI